MLLLPLLPLLLLLLLPLLLLLLLRRRRLKEQYSPRGEEAKDPRRFSKPSTHSPHSAAASRWQQRPWGPLHPLRGAPVRLQPKGLLLLQRLVSLPLPLLLLQLLLLLLLLRYLYPCSPLP